MENKIVHPKLGEFIEKVLKVAHVNLSKMCQEIHMGRSIGQKEDFCPHKLHQAGREDHIRHGIALIIMDPSLHQHCRNPIYAGKHKPALMAGYRGYGKSLYITVINGSLDFQLLCIVAKAGPQHQCHLRFKGNLILYTVVAVSQLVIHRICHICSPFLRKAYPSFIM